MQDLYDAVRCMARGHIMPKHNLNKEGFGFGFYEVKTPLYIDNLPKLKKTKQYKLKTDGRNTP